MVVTFEGRQFQKGLSYDRTRYARLLLENKELQIDDLDAALREPTDKRVFLISKAMHKGYTVDQIHELTKIDRWFLNKLKHIIDIDEELKTKNVNTLDKELLRTAKVYGFT